MWGKIGVADSEEQHPKRDMAVRVRGDRLLLSVFIFCSIHLTTRGNKHVILGQSAKHYSPYNVHTTEKQDHIEKNMDK